MTLDALMARQKDLAQQRVPMGEMRSPMQGVAYAFEKGLQGFQQGRNERNLEESRDTLSQIISQMDPATGGTPEQLRQLMQVSPDIGLKVWGQQAERAGAESFRQLTPEEIVSMGLDPGATTKSRPRPARSTPSVARRRCRRRSTRTSRATSASSARARKPTSTSAATTSTKSSPRPAIGSSPASRSATIGRSQYVQANAAAAEFLATVLRKESGAALSEQDWKTTGVRYLPQPGDPPEVIADKRRRRQEALNSLRYSVGGRPELAQVQAEVDAYAKGDAAQPDQGGGGGGGGPDPADTRPTPPLTGTEHDPKTGIDIKTIKPGDVMAGSVFLGGDPLADENWRPLTAEKPATPAPPAAATPAEIKQRLGGSKAVPGQGLW